MGNACLGLDVGFGNLKIVSGETAEHFQKAVLPVGAAPVSQLAKGLNGEVDATIGHQVLVGDEHWVAGADPTLLQNATRVLNADYTRSREYKALFHAALLRAGTDHIGLLVTGLPVSQHLNSPATREDLSERLRGRHFVTKSLTVQVDEVQVLPQPVGAYCDAVYSPNAKLADVADSYTLVFDPGYFSVDWVVMYRNRIRDTSSGTSTNATSEIISKAAAAIAKEHGHAHSEIDRVEESLRLGRTTISMDGSKVDIMPAVNRAALATSTSVTRELQNKLRTAGHGIDRVILAGGGASLYEAALREAFPKAQFIKAADSVLSNARGFYYAGRRVLDRMKKAAT